MSLITPLNRVLGLGTAAGATQHWWAQRLTAVALVPLGLWFAVSLAAMNDYSHAAMATWISNPITGALLVATTLSLIYHSWLGVQVVVEDYIHTGGLKVSVLVLSTFAHILGAIAGVFAILQVALGTP